MPPPVEAGARGGGPVTHDTVLKHGPNIACLRRTRTVNGPECRFADVVAIYGAKGGPGNDIRRSDHILQALQRHNLDRISGGLGLEDGLFFREGIDSLVLLGRRLADDLDFHETGNGELPRSILIEILLRSAWQAPQASR